MFTIEHDFDATIITLVDEPVAEDLQEDVAIRAYDDRVEIEQYDPDADEIFRITLSMAQLEELRLALNLPEGSYRLDRQSE